MPMSKKDFIGLADALKGSDVAPDVVDRLCAFMSRSNPRFKASRWRSYLKGECGPNGGAL